MPNPSATIPASSIVTVNPGVIGSGGNPLVLNGVILSKSSLLPSGRVQPFASVAAVSAFFGPSSVERELAVIYFLGYDNSTVKPGTIYFAPFHDADQGAWLQSGNFSGIPLSTLTTLSGSLIVTVDGYVRTASSINLSSEISFSGIADELTTELNDSPATVATSTASSIAADVLTVGGTITGEFAPGQTVDGVGVTANSIILEQLTGTTGGAGTYKLSVSSTVAGPISIDAEPTPVLVMWNAINSTFTIFSGATGLASTILEATGTLAASLKFTSATGAIVSPGAVADTPTTAMENVVANTQNWVAFMTMFEPVLDDKLLYAQWCNGMNQRYFYACWDSDDQAIVSGGAGTFGVLSKEAGYIGVSALYNTASLAAFVLGAIASINFAQTNGRITLAFKTQSGFTVTVNNEQDAENLLANGYSFYGAYATANDQFNFFYNGQTHGIWLWIDTFVNQVYLNAQFQLALMSLLTQIPSVPYIEEGYNLIRAAMIDPIQAALNFGSIRAGVTLSEQQKSIVNQAAGNQGAAQIVQNQGYYLQILDPGSIVRGQRGTPVINFWYTDGGAVQQISLASIDII